jgi:hypothetical protein
MACLRWINVALKSTRLRQAAKEGGYRQRMAGTQPGFAQAFNPGCGLAFYGLGFWFMSDVTKRASSNSDSITTRRTSGRSGI